MKKLSVVIVSYNVKSYLEQCILSLREALRSIDSEIVVVDNHSTDETVEYLNTHYPYVRVLRNESNVGFSKANNQAIRTTQSEYVLLLNPDTIVGEDVISGCLDFMDSHIGAGAAGVRMLQTDGQKAPESRRGFPSPFTAFCKFTHLHALFPHIALFNRYYLSYLPWDIPVEIDVVSGAFMMIRRSALQTVGLLDEDFFMYGEDVDLSFRLKRAGFSNWYLPFNILHYKGQSTQKTSYRYVHVFYGAMKIFLRKHYAKVYRILKYPLTMAIWLVGLLSFMRIQLGKLNKPGSYFGADSPSSPLYYMICSETSRATCDMMVQKYRLEVSYLSSFKELQALLEQQHSDDSLIQKTSIKQGIVVFDSSLYTCRQILQFMASIADSHLALGVYWPDKQQIITSDAVFKTE